MEQQQHFQEQIRTGNHVVTNHVHHSVPQNDEEYNLLFGETMRSVELLVETCNFYRIVLNDLEKTSFKRQHNIERLGR